MNKYEQLIEYVINEENEKAEELFHEIVIEKSRDIYESLMDEEEVQENFDGVRENDDEEPADGMDYEEPADEMGMDYEEEPMNGEEGGEEELEDRVVDLEDQMDALMAEFDELMSDEEMPADEMGMDYEEPADEMGMDYEEPMEGLEEAVKLSKVTKGISNSTEEGTVNKKSANADNSGKKGAVAKPHQEVGEETSGAADKAEDMGHTMEPRQSRVKEPKKKGEAGEINKKSIQGS